jgi:hypothetical protein
MWKNIRPISAFGGKILFRVSIITTNHIETIPRNERQQDNESTLRLIQIYLFCTVMADARRSGWSKLFSICLSGLQGSRSTAPSLINDGLTESRASLFGRVTPLLIGRLR